MNDDLLKLLELGNRNKKVNRLYLNKLHKQKPAVLDKAFHQLHDQAFQKIDCLSCANCCKTTSPIFRDVDINRIAKHLKLKSVQFVEQYLHLDEDQDYVLNTAPCSFLGDDNKCDIYEVRPQACREYPHTDRKNMFQILDLTYKNTLVCPAVNDVVENLKKVL